MKTELKILMLDDDVHDAELIKGELRKGGLVFRARRVDTEKAFMDVLAHDPPDLILSDHGLPSFNGFEALALAKQKRPDVPFVFVTGLGETDPELELLERAAVDYVLKSQLSRLVPVIHRAAHEAEKRRERRKHEPRLHPAKDHFRAMLDSVRGYAICRLDEDGCVSIWNAGVKWFKDDEADEIVGQHFSSFYPAEAVANGQPAHALAEAIAQGYFEEETVLLRKGGVPFWAEVAIAPLRDVPESVRGFALVMHDITARKEREVERERLVRELQSTLHNVKILSGLMPICPSCKKVRDYKGQWHPLEVYLQTHSEATLVHEFCEECARHITLVSGDPPVDVL